MMLFIRRRRHLGTAIDPKILNKTQPLRADVHITECRCDALGRTTISAWLFSSSPGAPEVIPKLLDVKVVSMTQNGFILSGVERIDDTLYAQSWLCQKE